MDALCRKIRVRLAHVEFFTNKTVDLKEEESATERCQKTSNKTNRNWLSALTLAKKNTIPWHKVPRKEESNRKIKGGRSTVL